MASREDENIFEIQIQEMVEKQAPGLMKEAESWNLVQASLISLAKCWACVVIKPRMSFSQTMNHAQHQTSYAAYLTFLHMMQFQPVMVKDKDQQSQKSHRKDSKERKADNDANTIEAAQAAS
ncbi:hypothetical protein KSP40_PGU017242 [Platanthera guangdongensis]|uniref:Uncharacterized protein n=1 Tax=Platanthera guangdongensis TaxID=2320717 RepID=A0ABR2LUK3_9ASPA